MSDAELLEARVIGETVEPMNTAIRHVASVAPANLFGTRSMAETMVQAKEAASVLAAELEPSATRPRALYKQIGEGRHVFIEGWTLLGSLLGVTPITLWTRKVEAWDGQWRPPVTEQQPKHSLYCKNGAQKNGKADHPFIEAECETYGTKTVVLSPGLGGWEACVEARTIDGRVIGRAEAECRWDEPNWLENDSYALRSMAQTRASSKALRMPLGFIVELAGYNATPAEEMDFARQQEEDLGPKCPACSSGLWDNREENKQREARGQKGMPAWKCKNRGCTGSDKGEPWIAWSANHFDRAHQERNRLKTMILGLVTENFDKALSQFGVEPEGSTALGPPAEAELAKRVYEAACEHVAIPAEPGPTGAFELDTVWSAALVFLGLTEATPFTDAEEERRGEEQAYMGGYG